MNKNKSSFDILVTGVEEKKPMRLDVWLTGLGITSRSQFQRLILDGCVKVDGRTAKPGQRVTNGQRIQFTIPPPERPGVTPERIPLDIIFEDDHLIVVNKPPGMVVHPGRGNREGTLVGALLYYTDTLSHLSGEERPGIVHRLDKNTSGLIICARNDRIHRKLSLMIGHREINRRYTALLWGHPREDTFTVCAPIGRHPRDRTNKMVSADGRPSETHIRVIARYDFLSLAEVSLKTGRTHQIRVHMAHIGHHVFGDPDYGGREKRLGGIMASYRVRAKRFLEIMPRQALHAGFLEFNHPVSGERIELKKEPPEDFQTLLGLLKQEEGTPSSLH